MSERVYLFYLRDIDDSLKAIESYLNGVDKAGFAVDRKTYSATLRELEIIGEAAGKLPELVRSRYPETNWRLIKDFRNVLAHEYFAVNLDIVWDIVHNKLPELRCQVARMLAETSLES